MKKLMLASLFIFISFPGFLPIEAAVVTHLDVDFSDYPQGAITNGYVGAGTGVKRWVKGTGWTGTVASVSGYSAGTQALYVYKTSSSSPGRGSVEMTTNLSLTTPDKIYMSFDLYSQSTNGTLELALSNGSFGTPTNLSFGLLFNTTSKVLLFNSSTATGGLTRVSSSFIPAEDTWYRLEFEITQSAVAGTGTFSVFASTQADGGRTAILTDQAYTFTSTSLPILNIVPYVLGSATDAVAINNIVLQSGLTDFPEKPFVPSRRLRLVIINSQN